MWILSLPSPSPSIVDLTVDLEAWLVRRRRRVSRRSPRRSQSLLQEFHDAGQARLARHSIARLRRRRRHELLSGGRMRLNQDRVVGP